MKVLSVLVPAVPPAFTLVVAEAVRMSLFRASLCSAQRRVGGYGGGQGGFFGQSPFGICTTFVRERTVDPVFTNVVVQRAVQATAGDRTYLLEQRASWR